MENNCFPGVLEQVFSDDVGSPGYRQAQQQENLRCKAMVEQTPLALHQKMMAGIANSPRMKQLRRDADLAALQSLGMANTVCDHGEALWSDCPECRAWSAAGYPDAMGADLYSDGLMRGFENARAGETDCITFPGRRLTWPWYDCDVRYVPRPDECCCGSRMVRPGDESRFDRYEFKCAICGKWIPGERLNREVSP